MDLIKNVNKSVLTSQPPPLPEDWLIIQGVHDVQTTSGSKFRIHETGVPIQYQVNHWRAAWVQQIS